MLRIIKRLLGFQLLERINKVVPTLRIARNDPEQPRTRSAGAEIKAREPVPPPS
jgi:hypothetical protein